MREYVNYECTLEGNTPILSNTEIQPRDKIVLFLLDITKLEDVFQECLWWDLSSHGHSDHRNKPQLAHIQTHDTYVGFSVFGDSHYKLTSVEWQCLLRYKYTPRNIYLESWH